MIIDGTRYFARRWANNIVKWSKTKGERYAKSRLNSLDKIFKAKVVNELVDK